MITPWAMVAHGQVQWAAGITEEPVGGHVVVGRPAFDVPALARDMAEALRNIGRPGIGANALSAVDVALWVLKARLLRLPVAANVPVAES